MDTINQIYVDCLRKDLEELIDRTIKMMTDYRAELLEMKGE